MDIQTGFQLEDPHVFLPWGSFMRDLAPLLSKRLRRVDPGYYTIACTSLGGMKHHLAFTFTPRVEGRLIDSGDTIFYSTGDAALALSLVGHRRLSLRRTSSSGDDVRGHGVLTANDTHGETTRRDQRLF